MAGGRFYWAASPAVCAAQGVRFLTVLGLGKPPIRSHISYMMNRRTLLRHALWAVPLAVSFGSVGAHAQSEELQRDLDRRLEQRERERALERQQDRNNADQQMQRLEMERRLREQQRPSPRDDLRRENNPPRPRGT